jgi:hypothetical protein
MKIKDTWRWIVTSPAVDHANSMKFRESESWERNLHPNLNCCFLIFKALIQVSRVEGGNRSLAAAPDAPDTRQQARKPITVSYLLLTFSDSLNAAKIWV